MFTKSVPKTAENFRQLCTGEAGEMYHYKGGIFHRLSPGNMINGGDTTHHNGMGGLSVYGHRFDDEEIWIPHTHKGVLSMAVTGPN